MKSINSVQLATTGLTLSIISGKLYTILIQYDKNYTRISFTQRYDTSVSIIIHNTIQITKTQTKDKIPSVKPIFANITLNHKLITVIRLSTQTVNSFHRHFQPFEYTTRLTESTDNKSSCRHEYHDHRRTLIHDQRSIEINLGLLQ